MNDDNDHEFLSDMAFTAAAVFVFVLGVSLIGAGLWIVFA
jgi:hypothetical protein